MNKLLRILKWTLLVTLSIILLLTITVFFYMQRPQFGATPEGERLERVKRSPHYRDGRFHNLVEKPALSEGYSIAGELYKVVFEDYPRRAPVGPLPSVKTDLKSIPGDSNIAVWFGHSSFFIQLNGRRFLVDPNFSGSASPLPWGVKAYKGTDIFSAEDMPAIDYLLISHDHYDHLDYETILALQHKVKYVVCGLGVGAHFEHWGYKPEQIIEKDWFENVPVDTGFTIYTASSHHESGRGFARGASLWMAYLIQTPEQTIYISGDGGFDDRFKRIGEKFGPVTWAFMENGQYDKAWQSVHNLPEEVRQATLDLRARHLVTVHHSKFTLGKHPWDEPLEKISALSQSQPYRLATPMVGEVIRLTDTTQVFDAWWKRVQ